MIRASAWSRNKIILKLYCALPNVKKYLNMLPAAGKLWIGISYLQYCTMKRWSFKDVIVMRDRPAMSRPSFIISTLRSRPRSIFTSWWSWRSITLRGPPPMRRTCLSRAARCSIRTIRERNRRRLCTICSLLGCSRSIRIMRNRWGLRRRPWRTWRSCFSGVRGFRGWRMIGIKHSIIV